MNKILFVDDMKEVYDVLNNSEIDYASNKTEAIEKINSGSYDLVISDYNLGNNYPKGGLDIVKAAKLKGIETILISRENHEREALEIGADKFMFKKRFLEEWKKSNQIKKTKVKD